MKILLLGTTLAFCSAAHADNFLSLKAPSKADAETWLNAFTDAQDMTRDGIVLKSNLKREELSELLKSLRTKAETLFGDVVSPLGDCTKSVESVNWYWQTQISLITDPTTDTDSKALSLVTLAWEGGEYYATCSRMISALP
ncbi:MULTISPECIES: hypothetical protein [Methylomonas]|uniref:PH domain-containing protein n=2 Tax=Methylomonas TaxID=416 RepID=A0A140E5P6_9GAMM|nr:MULTISPECIES: hypothetical protein [Methylomonas]AMK78720.1 hypothetical protein JT25_019870 [Methylomonas denitrificans]OAH99018.1 hypothetical protein A1342_09530 [Methylomonas methanica]TCV83526.1 hypothetical protein EDE11_10983 [Methylomonas methanica]